MKILIVYIGIFFQTAGKINETENEYSDSKVKKNKANNTAYTREESVDGVKF